ncbi:prepilin peptidase [Reyranella sp. CPCC 100927]|uniref:A24 family peptidase n=1 Tax=Reyranella sp. CPCC 100927 TaxID=2599616 RepID=UPI0011B4F0C5|nr:prepilin peptidase [Reyranella sp. CPCC 100927]TWT10212.1 hypothetical protein FQU96_19200 [Reyranella sp. CPCC 100927]
MSMALPVLTQGCVLLFVALAIQAARSDWACFIIPNHLPLAIVGLWAVYSLLQWLQGYAPTAIAVSAGMAVIVFSVGFGLFAANLFGGGDVKLLAAASLWAAPDWIPQFVMIVAMSGAVLGIAFMMPAFGNLPRDGHHSAVATVETDAKEPRLKRKIPYGTAIAVGCAAIALRLLNLFPFGAQS